MSLRLATRPAAAALVAVASLLTACGGGDRITAPDTPTDRGSFSGNVSGSVSKSLGGVAYYGQAAANTGGGAGLAVVMGSVKADSSFADVVLIARENRALPAPGTYPFHNAGSGATPSPEAFLIVAAMDRPNGEAMVCFGTAGTLTVRSAGSGRVRGTYTTQASCLDTANPETEAVVTLTGTFDAVEHSGLSNPIPGISALRATHALRATSAAAGR